MAQSPAHRWGQIIGEFLEQVFKDELTTFAKKHGLYLDTQGKRLARKGRKVSWIDSFKNSHDLDFVIERGGTENQIGTPVAFIESAWRRYTKHSKNKAQEIQGAILPLVATHRNFAPFIGVMLAGEFTGNALTQLKSLGFGVLYFPYSLILKAFEMSGLDASTEESTLEKEFRDKIEAWENFSYKEALAKNLLQLNQAEVKTFFDSLEKTISRFIVSVRVTPLHGTVFSLKSIEEAINFIIGYNHIDKEIDVLKYEIVVKYNNNDKVEVILGDKKSAIELLESYAAPKPKEG